MSTKGNNNKEKVNIILSLDIGSSSIRCSPYVHAYVAVPTAAATALPTALPTTSVKVIKECSVVRKISSVKPNTGKIILYHSDDTSSNSETSNNTNNDNTKTRLLFDEIDNCIDETLHLLRSHFNHHDPNKNTSSSSSPSPTTTTTTIKFQIIGIGISSFVMNLIGINNKKQLINEEATMSYACNTPSVVKECQMIQHMELQNDKCQIDDLYQRTGTPLHNAYALGQLRVYYNQFSSSSPSSSVTDDKSSDKRSSSSSTTNTNNVHQWTTISSYCILRWMYQYQYHNIDKQQNQIPISYSEASWTGLFNFHTCTWDEKCLALLPKGCRDSLPLVADFSATVDATATATTSQSQEQQQQQFGIHEYGFNSNGKRVNNPYWERWPELRYMDNINDDNNNTTNCRIYLGIGDGICANIGSKCTSPDRIACTIGTSVAARLCLPYNIISTELYNNQYNDNHDKKEKGNDNNNDDDHGSSSSSSSSSHHNLVVVPYGLFCYRIDKSHVLLGGALTDGGSIVEFLRQILNLKNEHDFSSCLEDAGLSYYSNANDNDNETDTINDNDNDNKDEMKNQNQNQQLSVIPFLSGERSTGFRGGATGCIVGLTRDTTPSDILRTSLESVVLRLNEILKLIEKAAATVAVTTSVITSTTSLFDGKAKYIVASGNALERNRLWRQMLSDCTGKCVVMDNDTHEGTSRGVAILISRVMKHNDNCRSSTTTGATTGITTTMDKEQLVIAEELIPNPKSEQSWSKRSEYQECAIQCISPMWK